MAFDGAAVLSWNPRQERDALASGRAPRPVSGGDFKAHRLVYHSTLGWRVIKKKKKDLCVDEGGDREPHSRR